MCTFRTSSRDSGRHSSPSSGRGPRRCMCSGRSSRSINSPLAVMHALEITFSSSRTFPGQLCCNSTLWPGNVRELENVISSACITASGEFIDLDDLPEHMQRRGPRSLEGEEWRPLSLDDVRKVHIQRVLTMCQGNRLRAAQILGIGRTRLHRYLKRDGEERRAPEKSGRASA